MRNAKYIHDISNIMNRKKNFKNLKWKNIFDHGSGSGLGSL